MSSRPFATSLRATFASMRARLLLDVEGALAEHVAREAAGDGVDHLGRRDARLGQPDEGLAEALRAVLGAEARHHEVAAQPGLLRGNRHAEAALGARHRLAHRWPEGHVEREQLDARDRRGLRHAPEDTLERGLASNFRNSTRGGSY